MAKPTQTLVTSAGRNHLLLSKQFCIVISIILVCAGVIFVRMEQRAVKQSMKNAAHVKEQNGVLSSKNTELLSAKKQLQSDEDELTQMYQKWLADDGKKLELNKQQIEELKNKIHAVIKAQDAHSEALEGKEDALSAKEDVLQDLHMQLRQKNTMMKLMKKQIRQLNGTLPTVLAELPDDDDWAW